MLLPASPYRFHVSDKVCLVLLARTQPVNPSPYCNFSRTLFFRQALGRTSFGTRMLAAFIPAQFHSSEGFHGKLPRLPPAKFGTVRPAPSSGRRCAESPSQKPAGVTAAVPCHKAQGGDSGNRGAGSSSSHATPPRLLRFCDISRYMFRLSSHQ